MPVARRPIACPLRRDRPPRRAAPLCRGISAAAPLASGSFHRVRCRGGLSSSVARCETSLPGCDKASATSAVSVRSVNFSALTGTDSSGEAVDRVASAGKDPSGPSQRSTRAVAPKQIINSRSPRSKRPLRCRRRFRKRKNSPLIGPRAKSTIRNELATQLALRSSIERPRRPKASAPLPLGSSGDSQGHRAILEPPRTKGLAY